MSDIINASKFLLSCFSEVLTGWSAACAAMADDVGENERTNGFQRCKEFLGGAWRLATIDQFNMEYIRYAS